MVSNIGIVMSGIDPQTRKYVGAEAVLKEQIAAVKANLQMMSAHLKLIGSLTSIWSRLHFSLHRGHSHEWPAISDQN